jgi:hypothetical protein
MDGKSNCGKRNKVFLLIKIFSQKSLFAINSWAKISNMETKFLKYVKKDSLSSLQTSAQLSM